MALAASHMGKGGIWTQLPGEGVAVIHFSQALREKAMDLSTEEEPDEELEYDVIHCDDDDIVPDDTSEETVTKDSDQMMIDPTAPAIGDEEWVSDSTAWLGYARCLGLDVETPKRRESIHEQLRAEESLTSIVTGCSDYAAAKFDLKKAASARDTPITSFLGDGNIRERLGSNMAHLKAGGKVLNIPEIQGRVCEKDTGKATLLKIADGFDVKAHPSAHHVEPPTDDCSDLKYFHATELLRTRRAVLATYEDFKAQAQGGSGPDCFPCNFHVVPKMGKGKATVGRCVTDLSKKTGNSVNGPRVAGKLLTSKDIAQITGEIVNPDHASLCAMLLLAISHYGDNACADVKDVNDAYFRVPHSIDAMMLCAMFLVVDSIVYVVMMAVASMGLFSSGFLWECVKNSIVYESMRRAVRYGITYTCVLMCVDDRIRAANFAFFEHDEAEDVAFLGGSAMGILGMEAMSAKKHQLGRVIEYTGHLYDMNTSTASLSYGRIARIVHTWIVTAGWAKKGVNIMYNFFMKILQYSYTLQEIAPHLSHYHRCLVAHLRGKNTSHGTSELLVQLSAEGAIAMNVFYIYILENINSDKLESWRVPLRFASVQRRPKRMDIRDVEYPAFVDSQIAASDYLVTVDASGRAKKLGIHMHASHVDGVSLPGAFARVATASWWTRDVDIFVLELLAGIYGILVAMVHLRAVNTKGKIVHIRTDNSVALAGHLKGTTKSISRSTSKLLRFLYLIRALLLEQSDILFTFSYIHTEMNVIADTLSRDDPPSAETVQTLGSCTEYLVPDLYP